jgi:hypothetical protein
MISLKTRLAAAILALAAGGAGAQGMDGAAHRHEGATKAPKATDPKADAAKP